MSELLAPGGTIGQTFASGSITKSSHDRTLDRSRPLDRRRDLFVRDHPDSGAAVCLGQFHEVGPEILTSE